MSNYLHVFPIVDGALIEEYEVIAAEKGLTLKDVERGRLPTREDFDAATAKVEQYDYTFDDDSGTMTLRQSTIIELFTILSTVAAKCGAQFVTTDNMALFIFHPETTIEQFTNSPLFN